MSTPSTAPLLLCFSHLRWDFVFQRPHHLLTRAAASFDVVFLEEPIIRDGIKPHLESTKRARVELLTPVLPPGAPPQETTSLIKALLDQWLAGRSIDVLWYYTPQALLFSTHLSARTVVYDNMDELSAFHGASSDLVKLENALFAKADLVFTGGRSLYEAKKARHPAIHCLPSSIDAAHFRAARAPTPAPEDQASIAGPRIGFFGVIDERMDLPLVDGLARAKPEWQFIFLGPTCKIDPRSLPKASNLHWLGAKPYAELPAYLASWDAGIMPFALNEATRFISPTKTPEFLAAGLPVVSTPIVDVVRPYGERGLVEIAVDAPAFIEKLTRVLVRPREFWLARVDALLSTMSWDRTWGEMLALIQNRRKPMVRPPISSGVAHV